MRIKHRAEYALLRTVIFLINLLPVKAILFICTTLGYIAWVVYPFRIKVAYQNLSTVFPELDHDQKMRLLKKVYLQFTRTFGLVFILHRKKIFKLVETAQISGKEKLTEALEQGKGVILTTIHASWFEAYFAWFNISDLPTSLIFQNQSNPLSNEFFIRQRKRYGNSLVQLSSRDGMGAFQQALTDNRLLIVSLDQRFSGKGTKVKFYNREMSCAKGTAILHLRTGSPVFTSVYYVKEGKLRIDFEPVELPHYEEINDENITDITSTCLKLYEPFFRQYPEQWFSLYHRLWPKKEYTNSHVSRSIKNIFL